MKLGVRSLKSENSPLLLVSRSNSPASRRFGKEVFWPSGLTVRAASGSNLGSAPCAPVGAKTQLTRTPFEAQGLVLRSTCFSARPPASITQDWRARLGGTPRSPTTPEGSLCPRFLTASSRVRLG